MYTSCGLMRTFLALATLTMAGHVHAADTCLVGSWEPVGNGAADWVQRQSPGMKAMVQQQVASLRLEADGSFRAQAQLRSTTEVDGIRGSSNGNHATQGTWSSSGNQLTLTPSSSQNHGELSVGAGKASPLRMKLPQFKAQPSLQQYTCTATTLETRMQIRGVADPILQRYRRR